jgi:3-methyl-2-oxobutanoate hydroxymethyltransferase
MKPDPPRSAVTLADFARWKGEGRKLAMLTAYDFTMAQILDDAGVDCLLVGDSLGTVVQGWDTTLRVTFGQMLYHAEMVARAAKRAFVISDLPFLSYQVSTASAVRAAGRILKRTQCQAVKVEGGVAIAPTIRAIVEAGIPVMGHVGLTPQSVRRLGGYKVQRDEGRIAQDAKAVAEAGAFAIVLECIPERIAAQITSSLAIPTIGIGAGPHCDGQVLVTPDLLGLYQGHRPKFARKYAAIGDAIREAAGSYIDDVRAGSFPNESESFR